MFTQMSIRQLCRFGEFLKVIYNSDLIMSASSDVSDLAVRTAGVESEEGVRTLTPP